MLDVLRAFDNRQFFRFFIDGCQLRKPGGWRKANQREPGYVAAMLNAWGVILDNFDLSGGVTAGYLRHLHATCASGVAMWNPKNTPGDLRYLPSTITFNATLVTEAGLAEAFDWRRGDGAPMFFEAGYDKPADELDPAEVLQAIRQRRRLTFRPWYPPLTPEQSMCLDHKGTAVFSGTFADFYRVKRDIQVAFAIRLDGLIQDFNSSIARAGDPGARLAAIARFIRRLELLHAFPDGNGRTYVSTLMNHLLLFHGFHPVILYDKDVVVPFSSDEWRGVIEQGMETTRCLLQDPEARVHGYSILDSRPSDLAAFAKLSAALVRKLAAQR